MSTLDRLESSVLFRLTRFLSLAVVAFTALVVSAAAYSYIRGALPVSTSVSTSDIRDLMKSQPESVLTAAPQKGSDREAARLRSEASGFLAELPQGEIDPAMMRAQLNSWLSELPDTDARIEFVREMRDAVRSFSDGDKASACFAFAQAKIEKIAREQLRRESLSARQSMIFGVIAGGLLLMGISNLVLVLLRIERNTRATHA